VLIDSREDVKAAFAKWNPAVRDLVDLFPDQLNMWAVFDLWDYPIPFYNRNRICLAGDAAHASSPHHGAGASLGIEDALCLSVLMSEVLMSVRQNPASKEQALITAFETYDNVRRARTQWLVNSSRRMSDLHHQPEWGVPSKWIKAETCFEEIKDRSYKICKPTPSLF
jgi:salicylate hydroxylase